MRILPCDVDDPQIRSLLRAHRNSALIVEPDEGSDGLVRRSGITFWAAWEDGAGPDGLLLGIGGLRALSLDHGEVKSMHVVETMRRRGVGAAMLRHIIGVARGRGYARLSLETGSREAFAPARALYRSHGFVDCGPFGDYSDHPISIFMTMELG
jgi:putative acetyltransferase